MGQTVEIKTADPRFRLGLSEGANATALRAVEAENRQLKAREGVRRQGDAKRWQRTQRRLARKYTVKPVGRARGAILLVWALSWMVVFECFRRLQAINREP